MTVHDTHAPDYLAGERLAVSDPEGLVADLAYDPSELKRRYLSAVRTIGFFADIHAVDTGLGQQGVQLLSPSAREALAEALTTNIITVDIVKNYPNVVEGGAATVKVEAVDLFESVVGSIYAHLHGTEGGKA
jgi:hypothetical protein